MQVTFDLYVLQAHIWMQVTFLYLFQARIWMQVMRELRTGVTLKKRDCVRLDPGEYELTPYEILMKDIRDKKHNLKHIAVS